MQRSILMALAGTFCLTSFQALTVYAGPGRSGGGNAIVCFNTPDIPAAIRDKSSPRYGEILEHEIAQVTSVETLDLNIARTKKLDGSDYALIEPLTGEKPRAYVERVAKRFEIQFPFLSKRILETLAGYSDDRISVREDQGLTRIEDENDSGYLSNKQLCVVATMAMQSEVGKHPMLDIDGRLFLNSRNSPMSRNVLLLHEVVYKILRDSGATDSLGARVLVKALISKDITTGRLFSLWESLANKYHFSHGGSFQLVRDISDNSKGINLLTEHVNAKNKALFSNAVDVVFGQYLDGIAAKYSLTAQDKKDTLENLKTIYDVPSNSCWDGRSTRCNFQEMLFLQAKSLELPIP